MSMSASEPFSVPSETELIQASKLPKGIKITPQELRSIISDLKQLNSDIKSFNTFKISPPRHRFEEPQLQGQSDGSESEPEVGESHNYESHELHESPLKHIKIGEIRIKPRQLKSLVSSDIKDDLVFTKRFDN